MVRLFNILDYRARLAQRSVAALDGLGYARKPAERVRSVLRSTREDKKYPQRRILIDTASYQTPEPKAIRYRIVRSGDGAPNTRRMSGGQVKDENASQDWVPAGLAELARWHRRCPGRGSGGAAGHHEGRILSPLQGPPCTSGCDARNLAGRPRHRDRAAGRSQRRIGSRETAGNPSDCIANAPTRRAWRSNLRYDNGRAPILPPQRPLRRWTRRG